MRILGVDIPDNKRVVISLTYIHGIGSTSSAKIVESCGIDLQTRVKDLTEAEVAKVRAALADYQTEGDLRRETQLNIKRLMEIGAYRGLRHRKGLPVRGQSSKTNARTRKGPKKTVANKKK